MPLTHKTSVFSVDECAIAKLLTDPSGGSPTYGAAIRAPGIKQISVDKDILTRELYGDATVITQFTKVRKLNGQVGYARLDLDVNAILFGGTVVDAGVTPNMTATYDLLGASQPSSFKIEARIVGIDHVLTGLGDVRLTLWKCRAEQGSAGGTEEDFATPSFGYAATRLDSNDRLFRVEFRETGATLV